MRYLMLILLLLVAVTVSAKPSDLEHVRQKYHCDHGLIEVGDPYGEVAAQCGVPTDILIGYREDPVTDDIQIWIYDLPKRYFLVTFVDGVIETVVGYNKPGGK